MPRPTDEPIPGMERLFLRVAPDYLDGPRVLPQGVRVQGGCSVSREKYMQRVPFEVLQPKLRPDQCCIAVAKAQDIPRDELEDGLKRKYGFVVADNPLDAERGFPANPAHAEVRVVRHQGAYDPELKLPAKIEREARAHIARAFTKCYQPVLPGGRCPSADDPQWTRALEGVEVC